MNVNSKSKNNKKPFLSKLPEKKKRKSKRSRSHPRTLKTYNNKLTKIKSNYNRLFKTSKQSKTVYFSLEEKDRLPKNKVFFCDKYPTFEDWLKVLKVKQVGKERARSYSSPTTVSKNERKRSLWGM